jgi:hypothetical protein
MECESYLKDSQHLLQQTQDLIIPDDHELISGDFDSLYNNIILGIALDIICDFVKDKFYSEHLNIIAFREILKIFFNFNIFKYKKTFYRQIKGIAMGSKCGPAIANIFVYIFEKKFLHIHRPYVLLYKRFIDDILLVLKKGFDINLLLKSFGDLKLNTVIGQAVNFLDLNISICKITRLLEFKLFIKPTNTFCYLPCHSDHPSFIFLNIPKSIFMRPRRICSSYSDFLFFCRLFLFQLLKRGYDYSNLRKCINMVSKLKRLDLIKYKEKNNFLKNDVVFFKFPFDFNYINCEKIIIETFNSFKYKYFFLENKKMKIINYMQPNLGRLLVHNFPLDINEFKYFRFQKCCYKSCSVCTFGSSDYFIKLKNNFSLPICINSNCFSHGIIYIIKCNLCKDVFYIGQSGRTVFERISEHVNDIKRFIPYYFSKKVSFHFNLIGHNYLHHLSFFIFMKNCDDLYMRLMYESQLIMLFENLNMKLLNDVEDRRVDYTRLKRRNNFSNFLKFDDTY